MIIAPRGVHVSSYHRALQPLPPRDRAAYTTGSGSRDHKNQQAALFDRAECLWTVTAEG
jgi:hypothetical protein